MPYPHAIRLHGPWTYEILTGPGAPLRGTLRPPAALEQPLPEGAMGQVRFERTFGRPSRLAPEERAWLVIDGVDPCGTVELNGAPLGSVEGYATGWSRDVTSILAARNLLRIEAPSWHASDVPRPGREELPGGLIRPIRLEVRAWACLDRVGLWTSPGPRHGYVHVFAHVLDAGAGRPMRLEVRCLGHLVMERAVEAGTSNLLKTELPDLSAVADWRPAGNNTTCPFEVLLADDHGVLWRATLNTLPRRVSFNARTNQLIVAERVMRLPSRPAATFDRDQPVGLAESAKEGVVWMNEIRSPSWYDQADRLGLCIIQSVPRIWADGVCPGLARHPCIVGWVFSGESTSLESSGGEPAQAWGRPDLTGRLGNE